MFKKIAWISVFEESLGSALKEWNSHGAISAE
jgi:hypothetical protein